MIDPSTLAAHIESLGDSRVACLGDVMLDRFVYGQVERTSPEAPVPVLRTDHDVYMLGGVGNVVRNLVSLGARATLLSVIGDDEVGRRLTSMVGREERVEPHLLVERGRVSTEKTRFVAGGQQLLRADSETTEPISSRSIDSMGHIAKDAIGSCDVIALSDYAKGVLTPDLVSLLIEAARAADRPVVVDPKGRDYSRYQGATVITPNRVELGLAAGETLDTVDAIVAACRQLIARHAFGAILVTRSHEGMTLVSADGRVEHLTAQAREVFDVSGAGDTVVATLAAALGQGVDVVAAAALANTAAGVVVGKAGTAVVHAADLLRAVRASDLSTSEAKIMPLSSALDAVAGWRAEGQRIGFTNGCFDLLHPGHISLLRQARQATDRLVVGLNSDASVRGLKGDDRPVQNEAARAQVLASLETVDLVVIFAEETPVRLIEALRPDCLVKGSDYALEQVVGGDIVQGYGGTVLLAENEPGYSTTGTIQRMRR
jgi:D-beta-D-heptose 7-phosphate kinase/D-beta-D-heptose 1-phosphate adenosyltransferase